MTLLDDAGSWTARAEADPLAAFRHRNEKLRDATHYLERAEVYVHAGNRAGKTTWGAAVAVSLLRREMQLSGEPLPVMSKRVEGYLFVPSYKQGMGSSIPLVLSMIGNWPHHVMMGTLGQIVQFRVKQRGCRSDDHNDWSRLFIYPHEGTPPSGANADFVWADEPPDITVWREAAVRKQAGGKVLVRYITATPLNREDGPQGAGWGEILKRFEHCLWRVKDKRIRIQTSMRDNKALTAEDLADLEAAIAGDPQEAARLRGEHVDVTNKCPFPYAVLNRWADRTRDPDAEIDFVVQRENDYLEAPISCTYKQWGDVDRSNVHLHVYDPATGINDSDHDPDCIHTWNMHRRALTGHVNGYLGEYAGAMALIQVADAHDSARNPSRVMVLRTGGYGMRTLALLRQYRKLKTPPTADDPEGKVRHWVILGDDHEANPGSDSKSRGVVETHQSRNRAITALQQALLTGDAEIPSAEVVQCLRECVIDSNGKIVAGPGKHDEHLICCGFALSHIQGKGTMTMPKQPAAPSSAEHFRDTVNRTFGRKVFPRNGAFMGHQDTDGIWG